MRNAIVLLWQSRRKLLLVGIVGFVVALVVVAGFVFRRQLLLLFTPIPYNPAHVNVPSYVGGYKVLAVFTPDNLACMNPGEIRLVLQAPESSMEKYLANSHPKDIQKDLEQHGLNATIEIVGPGVTIYQIIRESAKWNQDIKKTGCIKLGPAEVPLATQPLPTPMPISKTYVDNTFLVSLDYPAAWELDNSGSAVYSGIDGFFQITAVGLLGASADALCKSEIQNNMGKEGNRYGTKPTVEALQVDGQHACLILPSDDQPESNRGLSLLVVQYPKSLRSGALLQFWADKNHMQNFITTLKFIR